MNACELVWKTLARNCLVLTLTNRLWGCLGRLPSAEARNGQLGDCGQRLVGDKPRLLVRRCPQVGIKPTNRACIAHNRRSKLWRTGGPLGDNGRPPTRPQSLCTGRPALPCEARWPDAPHRRGYIGLGSAAVGMRGCLSAVVGRERRRGASGARPGCAANLKSGGRRICSPGVWD